MRWLQNMNHRSLQEQTTDTDDDGDDDSDDDAATAPCATAITIIRAV